MKRLKRLTQFKLWNSSKREHVFLMLVVCILLAVAVDLLLFDPADTEGPESQLVHELKPMFTDGGETSDAYGPSMTTKVPEVQPTLTELRRRPQFVVLAFDGSKSIPMWDRTLDFADEMKLAGYPIHYTYFLNAVYFLDPAHRSLFQAPNQKAGVSNIGFANSKADVLTRIQEVNRAIASGHDIGSHNAGHFDGTRWDYDQWLGQLRLFDSIMFGLSSIDPDYKLNLKKEDMIGFRAPELGVNKNMYAVLKKTGYQYDTSKVGLATEWPKKDQYGLWQFSLPTILVKDTHTLQNRYTIGMDYNFYMMQTGAKDRLKKGTRAWDSAYQSTLAGYRDYFYKNYRGNHAPVYVANHFSYWNDGLYWEVMRDFAKEVCILEQVQCVSFKELKEYMESVTK